jgi:hypothetical protein
MTFPNVSAAMSRTRDSSILSDDYRASVTRRPPAIRDPVGRKSS